MRTLVWFRGKDLRVRDHIPLAEAVSKGEVIPLFVLDPYFFAPKRAQAIPHRIQFLLESLAELAESIGRLGSRLIVVRGKSVALVPELVRTLEVDRVVGYRWTEPIGKERDRRVLEAIAPVPFDLYDGERLVTPGKVLTSAGTPFAVFTPFARACLRAIEVEVDPRSTALRSLPPLPKLPRSVRAREIAVPRATDLGIAENPRILRGGETAAWKRLGAFLRGKGARYDVARDFMGEQGTSRISQDLKFGTLSVRTVWRRAREALAEHPKACRAYLNELLWREFACDVLDHRPWVLEMPFKPAWRGFPWRYDEASWNAWVVGTTGYPVVDAAARQLLAEGYVHNRARMIAASFLTKHLLVDFRRGEAHYMQFLTDGDWASNDLGWQWATGCGVDAQPWFRVFNPVLQGERYDADGTYVRKWLPELAGLPDRVLHRPWEAREADLARAGIVLGKTYPRPIVDHAFARQRFLVAAEGHLGMKNSNAR